SPLRGVPSWLSRPEVIEFPVLGLREQPPRGVPGRPGVRRQGAFLSNPFLQERNRVGIRGVAGSDRHPNGLLDRTHLAVAAHLREDRRRADDGKEFVRVVLGHDLDVEGKLPTHGALELDFVHVRRVHVRRLRPQLRDDLGEQFRLEVVEGHLRPHYVNLLRRDHDDLELRHLLDLGGEGLPFLRREFLRVAAVHLTQRDVRFHGDARDDEGTDDGPSAGLVHTHDHGSCLKQLAGGLLGPRDDVRRAAVFMSPKTSIALLEIGESVPRPTTTPSWSISGTGATPPLASFMFDTGQWATLTSWRARERTSFIVVQTQWAAVTRGPRRPIFSSQSIGRRPVAARWPSTSPRVSERCMCI